MCRPVPEGGLGFDYRLNMSVPDMWIKLLKEKSDDEWDMGQITFTLVNRRWNENHISYCESHDQSIVGDKTISMWLFDREIYTNMSLLSERTIIIDRGMALHKMIRLISLSLGGEGYLNFIGNEFGHPEWLDFPRNENNHSYNYCRRQWNLSEDKLLRYKQLQNFDNAMINLAKSFNFQKHNHEYITNIESDKIIVFEKGLLLFVFNFHPSKSYEQYTIGTQFSKDHTVVLSSDDEEFGGFNRVCNNFIYKVQEGDYNCRKYNFKLYVPSRCAIVLKSDF